MHISFLFKKIIRFHSFYTDYSSLNCRFAISRISLYIILQDNFFMGENFTQSVERKKEEKNYFFFPVHLSKKPGSN